MKSIAWLIILLTLLFALLSNYQGEEESKATYTNALKELATECFQTLRECTEDQVASAPNLE